MAERALTEIQEALAACESGGDHDRMKTLMSLHDIATDAVEKAMGMLLAPSAEVSASEAASALAAEGALVTVAETLHAHWDAPSRRTSAAAGDASKQAAAALRQPAAAVAEAAQIVGTVAQGGVPAPAEGTTLQLAAVAAGAALRLYRLAKAAKAAEAAEAAGRAVAPAAGPAVAPTGPAAAAAAATAAAADDMEPQPPKSSRHEAEGGCAPFRARAQAIAAKAAAARKSGGSQAMLSFVMFGLITCVSFVVFGLHGWALHET